MCVPISTHPSQKKMKGWGPAFIPGHMVLQFLYWFNQKTSKSYWEEMGKKKKTLLTSEVMVKLRFFKNAPLVKEHSIGTLGCSIGTIFLPFTRVPKLWEDRSPVLWVQGGRGSLLHCWQRDRDSGSWLWETRKARITTEKAHGSPVPPLTRPPPCTLAESFSGSSSDSQAWLTRAASLLSPGAILLSFTALYDCVILIPFYGFKDHTEASVEADASIPVSYLPLHHFSRILQDSSSWMAYRYFNLKNCQLWAPSPQSTWLLVTVLADGSPRAPYSR